MGYKKGPVGHMKSSTENKAVGYMAEGSAAYMSALHQIDPRSGKKLDEVVVKAGKKLENLADIKSGYGTTQEKTVITAPKQKKLDVGAYEQTYRESAKEVTGKDFGYMTNRGNVSDAERTAAGLTTANKQNIVSQRGKFQDMFGKGVQPNKPFIDATAVGDARTGKEYLSMKAKQEKRADQRMQSNILAEKSRQKLEQKPVTITTRGVADVSSYTTPSMPTTDQSTKKKPRRQILGSKSFKNKSDYTAYKKSFKS